MKTAKNAKVLSGLGVIALLGLTACGGGDTAEDTSTPADDMTTEDMATESDDMASDDMTSDDMASDDMATDGETEAMGASLVGAGCEDYAAQNPDGPGSVDGMAQDPVATAASNNPMLTTLTDAVSGELNPDVDLVDTLNNGEFTVFAPVDEAFEAIPEEDLTALAEDADALSSVLTYHVVEGQMSPEEIAGQELDTVQGEDTIMVEGEGDDLMINDASVVCGGVETANATVYLIDEVLMPEMAQN